MWLIMCTHRDFLISNAIRICKIIGVSFEVKEDDSFVCDGNKIIGLRNALGYIYKKEAGKI